MPRLITPARVLYGQFQRDVQELQRNLVFGEPDFDAQLEANKQVYFDDFVTRPDFVATYGTLTNAAYVDALLTNAGITPSQVRLFRVNIDQRSGESTGEPNSVRGRTTAGVLRNSEAAL